ncbi:MAG: hypothetical protein FJ194_09225 [Gammaproteobacteria bacterium]|nr:hypothetical protein [Gammaproteobacteria bacterium]
MLTVITFFWQLCTLRAHTSKVPTASWFVAMVVLANLITSLLLSTALSEGADPWRTATAIVVPQATFACLLWLALYFRSVEARFLPTLTSVFGCDLLLTALLGATLPLIRMIFDGAADSLLFAFFLWTIVIYGHIVHQALDIRYVPATGVALGMWFLSTVVAQAVLENPA